MKNYIPKQTVADLIKKLQELPQDMPIATYGNPFNEIVIKKYIWEHTNYHMINQIWILLV